VLLRVVEAIGQRLGGVEIANGDRELARATGSVASRTRET
jgi:hypothetical protein